MSSGLLKNVTNKLCWQIVYINMFREDLAISNQERLICHKKTPTNQNALGGFVVDTIYQPLRSGRIWHKVIF